MSSMLLNLKKTMKNPTSKEIEEFRNDILKDPNLDEEAKKIVIDSKEWSNKSKEEFDKLIEEVKELTRMDD